MMKDEWVSKKLEGGEWEGEGGRQRSVGRILRRNKETLG